MICLFIKVRCSNLTFSTSLGKVIVTGAPCCFYVTLCSPVVLCLKAHIKVTIAAVCIYACCVCSHHAPLFVNMPLLYVYMCCVSSVCSSTVVMLWCAAGSYYIVALDNAKNCVTLAALYIGVEE